MPPGRQLLRLWTPVAMSRRRPDEPPIERHFSGPKARTDMVATGAI
jgi:hypothetical protein